MILYFLIYFLKMSEHFISSDLPSIGYEAIRSETGPPPPPPQRTPARHWCWSLVAPQVMELVLQVLIPLWLTELSPPCDMEELKERGRERGKGGRERREGGREGGGGEGGREGGRE